MTKIKIELDADKWQKVVDELTGLSNTLKKNKVDNPFKEIVEDISKQLEDESVMNCEDCKILLHINDTVTGPEGQIFCEACANKPPSQIPGDK